MNHHDDSQILHVDQSKARKKALAIGGVIVFLVIGFAWYVVDDAIANARFQVSKSFVRSHLQGLMVYAGNNRDLLPTADQWPDILIREGIIDESLMTAPSGIESDTSYFYIPGDHHYQYDGNRILVYENPRHWRMGVIVGFEDGSTEFLPHDEFERVLTEQLADREP
jgi:hypothetical protein